MGRGRSNRCRHGWQQEPNRSIPSPEACMHLGVFGAKMEVVAHDLGHEWICDCGQTFVVTLDRENKKVLTPKERDG